MEIYSTHSFSVKTPTLFFRSPILSLPNQRSSLSLPVSNQTETRKPITCTRNKRIRSGSERSTIFMLQSAYSIAAKLNIIPEPLDLAIREFSGGNGGGLGFRKDFGWGGFDGRRRNKKRKLGFWGFLMFCGLGLWLILGKELDSDVFRGFLGLALFGISVNGWKDWVLGFCSCAFLVGVGLRRDNLQSWAKGFKAMEILRRRKRRGTWLWRL